MDANSDATITLERDADDPELRTLTFAKVKNGVDGGKLAFRLESVRATRFEHPPLGRVTAPPATAAPRHRAQPTCRHRLGSPATRPCRSLIDPARARHRQWERLPLCIGALQAANITFNLYSVRD